MLGNAGSTPFPRKVAQVSPDKRKHKANNDEGEEVKELLTNVVDCSEYVTRSGHSGRLNIPDRMWDRSSHTFKYDTRLKGSTNPRTNATSVHARRNTRTRTPTVKMMELMPRTAKLRPSCQGLRRWRRLSFELPFPGYLFLAQKGKVLGNYPVI